MTTGYARKCLELLGWRGGFVGRPTPEEDELWIIKKRTCQGLPHILVITDEELITKTIEQLIKREDVMKRVCRWLNTRDNGCYKWEQLDGSECWRLVDQSNGSFNSEPVLAEWLLNYAIEIGITPEQLMGVDG